MQTRRASKTTDAMPLFFSPEVSKARRFYLDLSPPESAGLAVVCGGVEHTGPNYAIHRATFPFFSLEYVVRGDGIVKLRGREHRLQPGRLFSYGPGIRHDITARPGQALVKYFVDFAGREAKPLLSACGLAPGQVSQVFPPTGLQAVFDELISCGLKASRRSGEICVKLLECLALEIADSLAPMEGAERLAFSTYHQARSYIHQHFRRLKTLEEISAQCHVNNAYLCRLFRRYDHQSPYQCLLRLKLNIAAERLHEPGALVKQVAEETGFNDPFHFSRAFKGVFGLAPNEFRKLR